MVFVPPFCPDPECPTQEDSLLLSRNWYSHHGTRINKGSGLVLRFVCRHCGSGFSERTFDVDYWTHRSVPYRNILMLTVAGAGVRQCARYLGMSHKVVANRQARLARQSLGMHARMIQSLRISPKERLVFDGFESFAYSQYHPNNIHLLIASQSQFVLASNAALLRRKGRMTSSQKVKRAAIEKTFKPEPNTIYQSSKELLTYGCHLGFAAGSFPIVISTDEKKEYGRALNQSIPYGRWFSAGLVVHETTSSKVPRNQANALFAVNYLDRQLRKDLSEHVRETVRFARRIEKSLERISIHLSYHNYFKSYRVNARDERMTHAEKAGLDRDLIESTRERYLRERSFGWREPLERWHAEVWRRSLRVPIHHSATVPKHLITA